MTDPYEHEMCNVERRRANSERLGDEQGEVLVRWFGRLVPLGIVRTGIKDITQVLCNINRRASILGLSAG